METLSAPNPNSNPEVKAFLDRLNNLYTPAGLNNPELSAHLNLLTEDSSNPKAKLFRVSVEQGLLIRIFNLDPANNPSIKPEQINQLRFYLDVGRFMGMDQINQFKTYFNEVESKLSANPQTTSRRKFLKRAATVIAGLSLPFIVPEVITAITTHPEKSAATPAPPIEPAAKPTSLPPTPAPTFTSPPLPTISASKTPEAVINVQVTARAKLKNAFPQLKDPISGQPLPFDQIQNIVQTQMVNIIGYGKPNDYSFRCFDQDSKKFFDIPISQVEIVRGSPVIKMPRLPYLGIRNDSPKLMPYVPDLGCSLVRVVTNNNEPLPKQRILQTMEAAAALAETKILYTYNPSIAPTPQKIKEHLSQILDRYDVELEIGNEPDETTNAYWRDYLQGDSLDSFIQFVKTTINEARKIRPEIKIVIGALANPLKNQERLVKGLQKAGVDLSRVDFAVHGYAKDELENRINHVKKVTGKPNLILTELGYNSDVNGVLPELIKFARSLGVSNIYLHELGRFELSWGFIDPVTAKFAPKAYYLQKFVIDETQNPLSLHSKM